jgi:Ran GTPase-activating protein (RanGAP) involved in mRNA processing and transport
MVEGLSDEQLKDIYEAKCVDLGIQVMPLQEKRFLQYCYKYIKNRDLNLAESGIGPASGKAIAECIRNNSHFCKLTLAKNALGDTGAVQLVKILSKALNLIHLDLSSNSLSPEGLVQILQILSVHESLVSLDICSHEGLHRNRLGRPGAAAIGDMLSHNPLLISLNLANTSIGSEGLELLSPGLSVNRSLQRLSIAQCGISGHALDKFFKSLCKSRVMNLNLAGNSLGALAADYIAEVLTMPDVTGCKLKVLDLSNAKLGFAACQLIFRAMTQNSLLDSLILEKNPIGPMPNPALTQLISDNLTLKQLNVSGCGLRSNGAAAIGDGLGKNHSLKVLLVASNGFEEEKINILADGLLRNSALQALDLSYNRLTDRAGTWIGSAIRTHSTLSQLLLRDNELKDESGQLFADLTRTHRQLVRISVENNPMSHRFMLEIRGNVAANLKFQGMNRTPGRMRELRELELQDTNVDVIINDITALKKEESGLLEQIERHKDKYSQYQEAEEAKTQAVLKESAAVQARRQLVLDEYYAVRQELREEEIAGLQEAKKWEDKITSAHLELVRKEKECNALKAYSHSCRTQFIERLDRLAEDLKNQKAAKKTLETSVLGLRKQVEVMKFDIENLATRPEEEEQDKQQKERKFRVPVKKRRRRQRSKEP